MAKGPSPSRRPIWRTLMSSRPAWLIPLLLLLLPNTILAQQTPFDRRPVLCLKTDGPSAPVRALAFSPDGNTLYASGDDKVIHVWTRAGKGPFVHEKVYRMPLGPGSEGVVNALAVSSDGRWLAAGGLALVRE